MVQIKFITEDSEQMHIQILIFDYNYFNRKVYTTDEKEATKCGLAEIDSILIKEKHKHLSKMSDRVSKMLKFEIRESIHRSIYR